MTTNIQAEPKTVEELLKVVTERHKQEGNIAIVAGAYGDMEDCEAIVEKFVMPDTGGTFTKFYGCSYLFKGAPFKNIVEGLSMAKSMISELPREILARSVLMKTVLVTLALFAPSKLIHYARVYVQTLLTHSIRRYNFPRERYNAMTNELRRALEVSIAKELKRKGTNRIVLRSDKATKHEFYELIRDIAEFIYLFIEHDNAYRMRLQDISEEIDKVSAAESITKEINRLFGIVIDRENEYCGIRHKWVQMRRLIIPALYMSKNLRDLTKRFILELDLKKIALDEHDWYFCLKRRGYRFRDIPVDMRLKEKDRIDKEKNHLFLTMRKAADGPKL